MLETEEEFSSQGKGRNFLGRQRTACVEQRPRPAFRKHVVIKYYWSKGEEWIDAVDQVGGVRSSAGLVFLAKELDGQMSDFIL